MKIEFLFLFFLVLNANAYSRGLDSPTTVGGLRSEDPFPNMQKTGSSLKDKDAALRIMRELGYGLNTGTQKQGSNTGTPDSEGKN